MLKLRFFEISFSDTLLVAIRCTEVADKVSTNTIEKHKNLKIIINLKKKIFLVLFDLNYP